MPVAFLCVAVRVGVHQESLNSRRHLFTLLDTGPHIVKPSHRFADQVGLTPSKVQVTTTRNPELGPVLAYAER